MKPDTSKIILEEPLVLVTSPVHAPFGDGKGVVAAIMQDGELLPPYEQCLSTPFQCIAERVGLAATAWAVFADLNVNPSSKPGGADQ